MQSRWLLPWSGRSSSCDAARVVASRGGRIATGVRLVAAGLHFEVVAGLHREGAGVDAVFVLVGAADFVDVLLTTDEQYKDADECEVFHGSGDACVASRRGRESCGERLDAARRRDAGVATTKSQRAFQ